MDMKRVFLCACLFGMPVLVAGQESEQAVFAENTSCGGVEKSGNDGALIVDREEVSKNPTIVSKRILQEQEKTEAVLASVIDRNTADAAAPKLRENTQAMQQLAQLFEGIDFERASDFNEEEFMATAESNFEVAERVNAQFLRLIGAKYFGSGALQAAVAEANAPVTSDDGVEEGPMTAEQAKAEIGRMKMLKEPDSRLLAALKKVDSAETASAVVPTLNEYVEQIRKLVPPAEILFAHFENPQDAEVLAAQQPIEEILKGVRAELLRIVKLEGFAGERFDSFNDAMDDLFTWLGETHDLWFSSVFDESFENEIAAILEEQNKQ